MAGCDGGAALVVEHNGPAMFENLPLSELSILLAFAQLSQSDSFWRAELLSLILRPGAATAPGVPAPMPNLSRRNSRREN